MELKILDTDRFFKDSPNAGEPDCICSRCFNHIDEDQIPLRVAIDQEIIYGKNKETGEEIKTLIDAANGLEYRLCESCQKNMGIKLI